ncbi:MAG TPA: oligosaccharide flippase family protein [bacterium]|nr:oligosaccharide flippase family protein [bacterium]HPN42531.1 oligosaccharide flippase family protein [bacterium]
MQTPFQYDKVSRKKYFWDTLQLGSGTAISQLILIFSIPVLSRIYTPDDFGIAALFSSIVMILSGISALRYELAILLPEDENDGYIIFIMQSLITLVFGVICGVIFWLGKAPIAHWLKAPEIEPYLWLSSPAIIFFGLLNGLNLWNSRLKKYRLISAGKVAGSGATAGIQLLFGILGSVSPAGLINGTIWGKVAECLTQCFPLLDKQQRFRKKMTWRDMRALAARYNKFPKFYCPSTLINNLSWNIPGFFLNYYFSPAIVGFYAQGDRLIRTPMNMISQTISQVFFQRGAEAHRNGTMHILFIETVQMLTRMGLLPILVLTVAGKELFSVILGSQWAIAGVYAQILALFTFFRFLSSPMTHIFSIVEKQENSLKFNIINLVIRIFALALGGIMQNPIITLLLFSISGTLTYGWLLIWLGRDAGVRLKRLLQEFVRFDLVVTFFLSGLVLFLKLSGWCNEFVLVVVCALVIGLYYLYLLLRYKSLLSSGHNVQNEK